MKRLILPVLLVFLLVQPAVAAGPTGEGIIDLLQATRMKEAETQLPRVAPDDPLRPWAEALLHFHHGDYDAAAEALPPEGEGGDGEEQLPWLRTRIAAARAATEGFLERTEENFTYRFFPGADAILVDYAVEALEGQRAAMARVLGVAPERPVVVEFFTDVRGFVAAAGLPEEWVRTTNTVAICKWDRMLVLSPMNMGRGYPWKDTLAHEYVHLVLSRASANRAPIWFQEGSAKVMESWWRKGPRPGNLELDPHSESALAAAVQDDELIPFEDMHPSMAALPSAKAASLAFAEVATAIDFILGEVGEGGYRRIVEKTALHGDVMRAVDDVLGLTGGRFEQRWRAWLGKQPLERRRNIMDLEQALEEGAAGRSPEETRELDAVLRSDRLMADMTRLGDLLASRGHVKAALIEYSKAAEAQNHHSPQLANKQARAWNQLGEGRRAREILEESVSLYPEFTPTVTLLAEVAHAEGDLRAAERWAWRSVGLNPFDPSPHRILSAVYEAAGREAELQRETTVLNILSTYTGW